MSDNGTFEKQNLQPVSPLVSDMGLGIPSKTPRYNLNENVYTWDVRLDLPAVTQSLLLCDKEDRNPESRRTFA